MSAFERTLKQHLVSYRIYVLLDTKLVISETFPQANLSKPDTTKARIYDSRETHHSTEQMQKQSHV